MAWIGFGWACCSGWSGAGLGLLLSRPSCHFRGAAVPAALAGSRLGRCGRVRPGLVRCYWRAGPSGATRNATSHSALAWRQRSTCNRVTRICPLRMPQLSEVIPIKSIGKLEIAALRSRWLGRRRSRRAGLAQADRSASPAARASPPPATSASNSQPTTTGTPSRRSPGLPANHFASRRTALACGAARLNLRSRPSACSRPGRVALLA